MSGPDPKETVREFHEYFARSYESPGKIATHIGVSQSAISSWLSGRQRPAAKSLAKLQRFLDAEAKRPLQGNGIRPIEANRHKKTGKTIPRPTRQLLALPLGPVAPHFGQMPWNLFWLIDSILPRAFRPFGRKDKAARSALAGWAARF